jgi:hypothetical protein
MDKHLKMIGDAKLPILLNLAACCLGHAKKLAVNANFEAQPRR